MDYIRCIYLQEIEKLSINIGKDPIYTYIRIIDPASSIYEENICITNGMP